jgi:hypothetical protein
MVELGFRQLDESDGVDLGMIAVARFRERGDAPEWDRVRKLEAVVKRQELLREDAAGGAEVRV